MGRVTVELTGDEARLLRSLDRVIAKERQLGQEVSRANQQSARSGKEVHGGLKDMDHELGSLLRSGTNALRIFGIGGGIAGAITGAVSLISSEAEKARKSLEALGQVRLEAGKGELGLGTLGGAGAPGAVDRLAAELGLPKDKVAGVYAKFAGQGISPAAAASQARRELVEGMGGPGWEQRRAETMAANPRASLAAFVGEAEARSAENLRAPSNRQAALRLARADIAAAETQLQREAATQGGYEKPGDIGMFALDEGSAQQVRVSRLRQQYRAQLGLPEYQAPGTTIEGMLQGRQGGLQIAEQDVEAVAQRLMDAAAAQERAAGNMESSQRSPR